MKFQIVPLASVLALMVPVHLCAQTNGSLLKAATQARFEHLTLEKGLPDNHAWAIMQDDKGFVWFGTYDGLCRYDGYQFKVYRHDRDNPRSLSSSQVRALLKDRAGALWVGTWNNGLNKYVPESESFVRYLYDPANPKSLSSNEVHTLCEDRDGVLWIGTASGLNRFNPQTETFTRYQHHPNDVRSLSHNDVYAIAADPVDTIALWLATYGGGLNKFDKTTGKFQHFRHDPANPNSLSHDNAYALKFDRNNALWIGTCGGGLNRLDLNAGRNGAVHFVRYAQNSLADKIITIVEDPSHPNRLWLGTWGGGLQLLGWDNQRQEKVSNYLHEPLNPHSLSHNNVVSLFADQTGLLWIGTGGGDIDILDTKRKPFTHYYHTAGDLYSLSDNDVRAIAEDRSGTLWIGTANGGLNKFTPVSANLPASHTAGSRHALMRYRRDPRIPNSLSGKTILSICEDRQGLLWLGTVDGLHQLDPQTGRIMAQFQHDPNDAGSLSENSVYAIYEDRQRGFFSRYQYDVNDPYSLSHDVVWSIYEDTHRQGSLWIATASGINQLVLGENQKTNGHKPRFIRYGMKDRLLSDMIGGILQDEQGNLWLSTSCGLSKFNPETGTVRNYDASDGLQSDSFHPNAFCKSRSGPDGRSRLFFGGANGFNVFDPAAIVDNPLIPPVWITDFLLANRPVDIANNSVLRQSILATESLVLSYNDRVITFEFAALNYRAPQKNRYRYKLEGFDRQWHDVGSDRRLVTYTNLAPRDYVFKVLGSNNDGIWNEAGASIKITVTPPWWQTWWLRLSFLVTMMASLLMAHRMRIRRVASRNELLQKEIDQRKQIEKALRESEERYRDVVEGQTELICRFLPDGTLTFVNDAYCRYFQRSSEELIGRSFWPFIPENDREKGRRHLASITPDHPVAIIEHPVVASGGETRWQQWTDRGFFDGQGRLLEFQSVGRDITERKQAEVTLRESEAFNVTVLDSLTALIAVLDQNGVIVKVNETWRLYADQNHATPAVREGTGLNYLEACRNATPTPDEYAEKCLAGLQALLEGRIDYFDMEYPCHTSTEQRWFLLRAVRLSGRNGGLVISHINITERMRTEEALRSAVDEIARLKEKLETENVYLRHEMKLSHQSFGEIIGKSSAIQKVLSQVEQVAATDSIVLIQGETGVGKDVLARAIHNLSLRKHQVMVKVNCASLPSSLIESELFGREKGAYTGALTKQAGRFEVADGSTIFLDEIGELSLELQAKLLRVLQDGEFERLGSPKTIKVDVRVIAATNYDLLEQIRLGKFREDLYYRLNVFHIQMPPLRQRKEDIPLLVWTFVEELGRKMGKKIQTIPKRTMDALQSYTWPGNIRQLRNVIEQAMILSSGETLEIQLPDEPRGDKANVLTLEQVERQHIIETLEITNWHIKGPNGAAKLLALKPSTLYSKMAKLNISTVRTKRNEKDEISS